jgi:tetratricopeptide (TPR) repeat protein
LILAYYAKNETASARQLIERIQNAGMEKGNSVSAILALGSIGKYYAFLGQHNEAMSYYNAASKLALQRKNLFLLAQTVSNSNNSLLSLGNTQQALDNNKQMITIYKNFGNKDFEAFANLGAAWASLYLNQFDQASLYANNALELTRNANKPKLQSDVQINSLHILGKVNFAKRNYDVAVDYFKKCLDIVENANDKAGQKHFWQDLEQSYTALGDNKNAKNARKKADKIK